ncbi:MAG: Der GTPase-activating protein YihI, partial [Colwellia sp.]|nr:Der GTPase-activating protein YihI [Colwellia sp.]
KKTGKKPGNRQQEAQLNKNTATVNQQKKDPRIGSKTPIALGGEAKAPQQRAKKPSKSGQDAIAAIRYVEPEQDLAQELAAIESDDKLQAILAKQEQDIALTEQEVDYFNDMMERHQVLTEQLGLDEDDSEEVKQAASKNSEDDLWDKLDNASDDFSQFE